MKRAEFQSLVCQKAFILDGATGTEMIRRGMPPGVCPEKWASENFDAVADIHNCYIAAGSNIVYVPTFGANACKLSEFGLEKEVASLNESLASQCRKNVGSRALIFGDLAPTGQFLKPFGDLALEELIAIYREQAAALLAGGVDGFVVETMMDVAECRAALLAIREICDLPVAVTMTFDASGRTLTGNDPVSSLITLQSLGADAFGCNCSTGPEAMAEIIAKLKPYATIPLIAKPNAGVPKLVGTQTVFSMSPEDFGAWTPKLISAGANLIGGCCGTTPEHIRAMSQMAAPLSTKLPVVRSVAMLSAPRKTVKFAFGQPLVVVGERINPTGKKALQEELRNGDMSLVQSFAMDQIQDGAMLLDVNVGMGGIDEVAVMSQAVDAVCEVADVPLVIDSGDPAVVEAALRRFPGRALVNSISAEPDRLKKLLPVAARYGAMLILLPLADDGIPETPEARLAVADRIMEEASRYGYTKEDVLLDPLVMTISTNALAANVTLETLALAAGKGYKTICGLSNVSYGMPERAELNAIFLALAMGQNLTAAIANPSNDTLMTAVRRCDALTGRENGIRNLVENVQPLPEFPESTPLEKVAGKVFCGDAAHMAEAVQEALSAGITPKQLVDEALIPAIEKVGEFFEEKKYFLPQLVMSADAMRTGFAELAPLLQEDTVQNGPDVILATVEGDIHDIGKNIVALMLKNYGCKVIDLGKDVSAEKILNAAREHNVHLIGLSALMTTTMGRMQEVIDLFRSSGMSDVKFILGGAVLDSAFAENLNAAYGKDAMSTVRWVLEQKK